MKRTPWLLLAGLSLAACTSAPPATSDAATDSAASDAVATPDAQSADAPPEAAPDVPPVMTTVSLFDARQFSFTGMDNRREQDAMVSFPQGPFQRVNLHLQLSCPSNRCDQWDRLGSLSLVDSSTTPARNLEFARFITPYGVAGSWDIDVTDLQLLFTGTRTVHGFVDTWVGPGSPYGNGWLVTARLEFTSGRAARQPVGIVSLDWTRAVYGDPAQPLAMQLPARMVQAPAGATSSELYVLTTGHGQGNAENCAEFCSREHTITVDGAAHPWTVWRDDCDQNPLNTQRGTWMYPRAGWCPGDVVRAYTEDLGAALAPGATHTLSYDVQSYVNTCRPMASPCRGCTLGALCPYDGGAHTEPFYSLAAYVVFFGS